MGEEVELLCTVLPGMTIPAGAGSPFCNGVGGEDASGVEEREEDEEEDEEPARGTPSCLRTRANNG